jgi:tyrosyl-tRNA synthetase
VTKTGFADAHQELTWRGMVFDSTPGCAGMLAGEKVTCYNGFDPSARSLHVGNMIPIMGMVNMQRHGHSPIAIVGGGTGMIGDPGGRKDERRLLSKSEIEENAEGIRAQLGSFLDFESRTNPARLINNADWLLKLDMMSFLRDVGKHFTVNYMLDKESVKGRLGRESGISYTEFSYMLLQAYDYLVLYREHGCRLQLGGSDQWGNILTGVDLIKRVEAVADLQGNVTGYSRGEPHAMVYPLITTASGEKFGKSIGGAPTLDPAQTSPYRLYQFFLNTDDRDVLGYLKRFTLIEPDEFARFEEAVQADPAKREAQRRLAEDATLRVHGQNGLDSARRVTEAFFGGKLGGLGAKDIEDVLAGAPSGEVPRSSLEGAGTPFDRFAVAAGLCASNAEARRLVEQGGVHMNDRRVTDARAAVGLADLIDGRLLVLRRGAKTYRLVRAV